MADAEKQPLLENEAIRGGAIADDANLLEGIFLCFFFYSS